MTHSWACCYPGHDGQSRNWVNYKELFPNWGEVVFVVKHLPKHFCFSDSIFFLGDNKNISWKPILSTSSFCIQVLLLQSQIYFLLYYFFLFFIFCLCAFSRASPVAYGGSQARGPVRSVATSLHHSHSNGRSETCLWPIPQLKATPDPHPTERGQGVNPQPHGS